MIKSYTASNYPTQNKFLRIAQEVTQKYIEAYGATFVEVDQLDRMIADAICNAYPPEVQAVLTAAEVLTVEDNWSRINLMKLVVAVRSYKENKE